MTLRLEILLEIPDEVVLCGFSGKILFGETSRRPGGLEQIDLRRALVGQGGDIT